MPGINNVILDCCCKANATASMYEFVKSISFFFHHHFHEKYKNPSLQDYTKSTSTVCIQNDRKHITKKEPTYNKFKASSSSKIREKNNIRFVLCWQFGQNDVYSHNISNQNNATE